MQISRFCFSTGRQRLTGFFLLFFILGCFYLYADEKDLLEEKSKHFIVHFDEAIDKAFIKDIIDAAEEYYDDLADNLGLRRFNYWLWDERAQIYIYANKEKYTEETNQPEWSGGCADYYHKKLWTYPHASGFFDSILPHELGHIMFRELVGFKSDIPLWLDEGVASYQEKSKRYAALGIVKDALAKGELLTIADLDKLKKPHDLKDNKKVELFYAEAVSIVYFLIDKYGKNKFVSMCRYLKENDSFDQALRRTYYSIRNRDDLNKEWMRFLKK